MSGECVFCEILAGKSPGRILYHDDLVTAMQDIHPIASTHILVVPNRHLASLNELSEGDAVLVGHMVMVAKKLAGEAGLADRGYRLIINTGRESGQSVFHLHLHLIGGRLTRFVLK
jgi:histidine triad (HIT) family protein